MRPRVLLSAIVEEIEKQVAERPRLLERRKMSGPSYDDRVA